MCDQSLSTNGRLRQHSWDFPLAILFHENFFNKDNEQAENKGTCAPQKERWNINLHMLPPRRRFFQ
jgi:hypothetical protein